MSNSPSPLRGMKDILPDTFRVYNYIEKTALEIASLYGYEQMATPILESASVFDRTLGETSDVISKEMYSFLDKKGRQVALRPEFTAGIVRSFISNGLQNNIPLKYFSSGPVFRYDRPQEGRQRQFHQLNFEYIGTKNAYCDAETISLACHILEELGILKDLTLELNSLGCTKSRESYQNALIEYFKQNFDDLSDDSKNRLEKNPLRILDSKDDADKEISKNAPSINQYYTEESRDYFNNVKLHLDNLGIKYVINHKLARGLDYYSHTTFEFTTTKLGAQSTVLAGGRYDGLTSLMGTKEVPSIGFAAGIERLALMKDFDIEKKRPTYVMPIGQNNQDYGISLVNFLRKNKIMTILDLNNKPSKSMKSILANKAKYVIFIGDEEKNNDNYKIRDLDNKSEKIVDKNYILELLG